LFTLVAAEQVYQQHLLLILQCHQVARVAQLAQLAQRVRQVQLALLLHLLIGILFVVILVVITQQFLAQALSQLLSQLPLQNKRVHLVVVLFKADNSLLASTLLQFLVLLQWFSLVLVETVTVQPPHVQLANLLLAA
jgi:hypothetical protein